MSHYTILDIETVPEGKFKKGEFPPPHAHRVVAIGQVKLDRDMRPAGMGVITGNEQDVLAAWNADFYQGADVRSPFPTIVTWAGRVFDLPVLVTRCFKHGIPVPWFFQDKGYRYRYAEDRHLDLCDTMSDFGAAPKMKLDAVAKLIGLPGKMGIDGSKVAGLFAKGKIADIADYCLTDCLQTAFVFMRYSLLRGRPLEAFRDAARALLDELDIDDEASGSPRVRTLRRLRASIDDNKLLLF